ncbi:N-acetylglucosamine-6-phosphate deacetylase [Clostridium swellfunianum]|uniref:N-acetylglucosamine-6-phosphate deacetylase n=1 Tax=Clostridium swellfunianum TaxID=1367462 RepID=UPI00203036A2|nr:N-acetylglucosamine-6-phosphate deacetylase [Clostridium swellfunianum]MCM0650890.1 N-acetylglucosamine-6-phosphate deacetylase [Clostridium swellfunianum]
MDKVKIFNGKIITPYRVIEDGCILIEGKKIIEVSDKNIKTEDYKLIDAGGKYIAPGFIDIHVHGGGGHDFMDGTLEAYLGAAEKHAEYGTTSMVPTTLTSTFEELRNTFLIFKEAKLKNKKGSELLGLHLEGPYFAMSQKGAQDPKYIKNPDKREYEEILNLTGDIIRWSAAPELEGALEFGRYLKQRGILPSIAHTDAVDEEVEKAFENGFSHVTHLYSAMSSVRRINAFRYAGVIEAAYLIDEMTVEAIADGIHLPKSLLKLIYKIKGADKIALVTDAMRAAGMPEGESILGSINNGQKVIVEDGIAKLMDRTAFAGSVATADRLIRTMVNEAQVSLIDVVKMMTSTPAKIIGVENERGRIVKGLNADIVIFDDNINIDATIIGGKIVFSRSI